MYFSGDSHSLQAFATSLRMGNLGYQSDAQSSLVVCYNDIDQYNKTLKENNETPYKAYEDRPKGDRGYLQLTTNLLQIENEFYSLSPQAHRRFRRDPAKPCGARGGI